MSDFPPSNSLCDSSIRKNSLEMRPPSSSQTPIFDVKNLIMLPYYGDNSNDFRRVPKHLNNPFLRESLFRFINTKLEKN